MKPGHFRCLMTAPESPRHYRGPCRITAGFPAFPLQIVLAALLLISPAYSAAPPSRSFLVRPVIIPIEVIPSGHIAIKAKINGCGPYRFIFDTGAPALVISEQVARASRILSRDFTRPFFTPLGNLGNFDVDTISVGTASQAHLQAAVWNHPTVEILSASFGRFEGLVGFPFFAHYAITIDYKTKTLSLTPCDFQPEDSQQKMVDRLSDPVTEKTWAASNLLGIRVAGSLDGKAPGVAITAVSPGSAAADAGVKTGDRLLTLDERWTDTVEDCYSALAAVPSPREISLTVLRGDKQIDLHARVLPGI